MGEFKKRVLEPAMIPLAATAVIGILTLAFSRILLASTVEGAVALAFVMAGVILAVAFVISATGSRLKQSQRVLVLLATAALLGAGAGSAALGIRELEEHAEEIEIAAENILFEQETLTFPADEPVDLVFNNKDVGVPHNVEIFPDDSFTGEGLFVGEVFDGSAVMTYEIDPLPAGTYAYRCVVHPIPMVGTLFVGEEGEVPTEPAPTGEPSGEVPSGDFATSIDIAAEQIRFDTDLIELEADTPVTITFDNQDGNIPHNVAIYRDESLSEALFQGEIFDGIDERTYEVPSLPPGEYFFRCDVHPNMNGTAAFG